MLLPKVHGGGCARATACAAACESRRTTLAAVSYLVRAMWWNSLCDSEYVDVL